jgi:hypothetical protein
MVHAIEVLTEAETLLRSDKPTPAERGEALACISCARMAIQASLQVAAEAARALESNTYRGMQEARRLLEKESA